MKLWTALFVALALCLSGFAGVAHADAGFDHALHDAGITHDCPEASDHHGKADAEAPLCKVVSHAPAMSGVAPFPLFRNAAVADGSRVPSTDDTVASRPSATPDQPPRLS